MGKFVLTAVIISLLIFCIRNVKADGSSTDFRTPLPIESPSITPNSTPKRTIDSPSPNTSKPDENSKTKRSPNKKIIDLLKDFQGSWFGSLLIELLKDILGGFIGAFIALWLEGFNEPKLDIVVSEKAHSEIDYQPPKYHPPRNGRWKNCGLEVRNKPVLSWIRSVFRRQVAQQVTAKIYFKETEEVMKGRWSESLELSDASKYDIKRLIHTPETINIEAGGFRLLDVIMKYQYDKEAYGWNNESYQNNWITPKYKLRRGYHEINVEVSSINGGFCKKIFWVFVSSSNKNTTILDNSVVDVPKN